MAPEETSARFLSPARPVQTTGEVKATFDLAALREVVDHPYTQLRREVLGVLGTPAFDPPVELD